MRIALLGSGSKGNGTVIAWGDTVLLVDCGFPLAETERRLARLGLHPRQLAGILVTHEHADHMAGVGPLARAWDVPVWMSRGSHLAGRCGTIRALNYLCSEEPVAFGEVRVFPFSVPHDAREPLQFVFEAAGKRLGVITDLGSVTPFVVRQLDDCDALLLECNHDEIMLQEGAYPPRLKARIAGAFGHLSNAQAASLLQQMNRKRLRLLIAAHLSEENNCPAHVSAMLEEVLGDEDVRICIAGQAAGLDWQTVA